MPLQEQIIKILKTDSQIIAYKLYFFFSTCGVCVYYIQIATGEGFLVLYSVQRNPIVKATKEKRIFDPNGDYGSYGWVLLSVSINKQQPS